ncbi:MAG: class I SAM-dependent methyltransferase [Nitrospirota bacterium]
MGHGFSYTRPYWSPSAFYRALEDYAGKERLAVLDVGCGRRKFKGATGIDERTNSLADIRHDLNTYPYPIPDNSYDVVICRHVLEHMDNVPATMEEFHRVAKPGGMVVAEVPHFTHPEAFRHWQHKHFFTLGSLDYFSPGNPHYKTSLRMVRKHIYIHDLFRAVGVEWLMNALPHFYERHMAFIIQASCILYIMKAEK